MSRICDYRIFTKVMSAADFETMYGHKFNDRVQTSTVSLNNAYANEVLDILNQIKSTSGKVLAEGASNSVILIDSPDKIESMTKLLKHIDTPRSTVVFSLNYIKAEDISGKLNEILTPNIGKIRIDAQSNKIMVTDIPQKVMEIKSVIDAFDIKEKQVLIEAKIVQVILSDHTQMGINWEAIAAKYHGLDFQSSFGILRSSDNAGRVKIGTLNNDNYTAMIEALQTMGRTKILSNPHIMATNNKEAKILVGSNVPYATTTTLTPGAGPASTSENVTFIEVGVKLYVTPAIHNDGYITMKIRPEVSSAPTSVTTADKNVIPVVETSQAETTVSVKDGVTIVIGGLIKNEKIGNVKKVPILGSIPLLGTLFRSTDTSDQKTELVIFLTPKIITGDASVNPGTIDSL